jgi:hypothetical protein
VAAEDISAKERVSEEAERLARRERISAAGGQILSAAVNLLGELVPQKPESDELQRSVEQIKARLADCVETDGQGQLKLTIALADSSALDGLARSLAQILQLNNQGDEARVTPPTRMRAAI